MIALLKDRYKLGLLLATVFLGGVLVSLYQVYRLPQNLMLGDAFHPAMINIYFSTGLTFLIGAFTIWIVLQHRQEIIVFRDKEITQNDTTQDINDSSQTTISLDSVRESIRNAGSDKDALIAGLQAVCKQLDAGQGAAYQVEEEDGTRKVELKGGYALSIGENTTITYSIGEGLIGQAAASGKTLYIDDVPEGYVKIISGLGSASPRHLLIVALKKAGKPVGVLEIASFTSIDENQRMFVEESAALIAAKLNIQ